MKTAKGKAAVRSPADAKKFRRRVLLCILLVLAGLFFYQGGVSGFALSMANNALIKHDAPSAERWLGIAQQIPGSGPKVEYMLAKKARLDSDFENMADHLRTAFKSGFDVDLLEREQILANASLGEMDAVTEGKMKRWIAQRGPETGDVVDAYANGLATLSRFEDAVKLLEEYEAAFPGDPMVNYRFGVMNEHKKNNPNAEKEYRQAIEKNPKHIKAAWRLARLTASKNDPAGAIEILEKLTDGPHSLAIKTFLAHCYNQLGDFERSRVLYLEVAEQGHEAGLKSYREVDEVPERFLAASELGALDVTLGNFEEAKRYLEMALEVNDKDFVARNSYAQALRRLGLTEQASAELARLERERVEFDKITILRDKVNQNPNDTEAKIAIGKILFEYESERFGLFWIRSALATDPNCQAAHEFLADYYESKVDENELFRSKAAYHRSRVVQSQPQSADAH